MKNNFLIISIIFFLIFLSGCIDTNQQNNNLKDIINNKNFEILHYKVFSLNSDSEVIEEGFIHDEDVTFYFINGEIKNKCGEKTNIKIDINFFDENNIFLDSRYFIIEDLPDSYIKYFEVKYFVDLLDYGNNIGKITFDLEKI